MEIKSVPEKKSLAVSITTRFSDLPNVIGDIYGEIMAYMQKKGVEVSGYPYVLYHNMDLEEMRIDVGWITNQEVEGHGRIKEVVLPGGNVLYALHTGPYSSLEKTYNQVMAFIQENSIKTEEWMYEVYLNSPEDTPEQELLTEIYFPIKH